MFLNLKYLFGYVYVYDLKYLVLKNEREVINIKYRGVNGDIIFFVIENREMIIYRVVE